MGQFSYTDIGNKDAIGGLSREFYRRAGKYYGRAEQWCFEPHVAEEVFERWLAEEGVACYLGSFLYSVELEAGRIRSLITENGIEVKARQYIDTSYEGDLMAKAGVSCTVGRESNDLYGEEYNGSQVLDGHQFSFPVDPYRIEGRPESGLLPGIDVEPHVPGRGDRRVQAYNFRLCLTANQSNRLPIIKPDGYDRSRYELLSRYCRAGFWDCYGSGEKIPQFQRSFRLGFVSGVGAETSLLIRQDSLACCMCEKRGG